MHSASLHSEQIQKLANSSSAFIFFFFLAAGFRFGCPLTKQGSNRLALRFRFVGIVPSVTAADVSLVEVGSNSVWSSVGEASFVVALVALVASSASTVLTLSGIITAGGMVE
jgi:hypothetical protein